MTEVSSPRKIRVYDYGERLNVFVGERGLAFTVKKEDIIDKCGDARCRACDLSDSIGGIIDRLKGFFRRN